MNVNSSLKGSNRFFAVTSLRKDRWYWVVWPSLEELQASIEPLLHIGEGYEKTKAEAVERALALAGRHAVWIQAKYARAYLSSKAGSGRNRERLRVPRSREFPELLEFLYRDEYLSGRMEWVSVPHRVLRKTRKFVYVERSPYTPDSQAAGWEEGEISAYQLDRQSLEREGFAFIPASADIADGEEPLFYRWPRQARPAWQEGRVPRCLTVLGLSWPCTVADVQEAYRRLVKHAHPDGGGTTDEFLALQEAYEQALRMFPKGRNNGNR